MPMYATGKLVPTCRTMQAVGEMTVSGFVAVMPNGTGQWCWGALGTVMTFRTSVTCRPSILWCGWPSPREAVVPTTTLAWYNTLSRGCTEEAWFNRKLSEIKMYPDLPCKTENVKQALNTVLIRVLRWIIYLIILLLYYQGHHKPWFNYLTFRQLIIIRSKWCVTWRAGQAVLRFCHPSVRIYGSSWTRVLVFGPGPERAVMTHWTLITPRQRAIMPARTIKTIQTKKTEWNNLDLGCL